MDKDIFKKQLKASLGDRLIDGSDDNNTIIMKLQSEVEWYRTYGQFINANYSSIDAEACAYADGDDDMDGYNNQEK